MKLKPALAILLLSGMLLSSCMKQVINPDGTLNTDANKNDVSTSPLSNNDSYQPITKGSTWNYTEDFGGQTVTSTITMTGTRTVINGTTYYDCNVVSSLGAAASGTGYFLSSVHQYNLRSASMVQNVVVDMPYLIDTVSVGNTWTAKVNDSGYINGIAGRFVGKMLERNISRTVSGKLYHNVMHTQIDLQYLIQGTYTSTLQYDYYVAKGVGFIELDSSAGGQTVTTEVLTSYTIK